MKINIKATGIELTPAISNYVHKKLAMIEKHIEGKNKDVVAQVKVAKVTEHHKLGDIFRAEVHIVGGGLDIYTEEGMESYLEEDSISASEEGFMKGYLGA